MNSNETLAVEKVTNIETKQAQAQCEFKITCQLRGSPIEITGQGRAQDLKIIVDRLFDLGAEPPQAASKAPQAASSAAGAPICPAHGTPMKASRKPGSYFCPRQAEDGSGYCPHKA
jgi:hypothetical protein